MHFSSWLTSLEDSTYINPSPCRYITAPPLTTPQPSLPDENHPPHPPAPYHQPIPNTSDHPLADHPWWTPRPHLLAVLVSHDPYLTASTLPLPSNSHQALNMLAQRSQRVHNILNVRRGCQRTHGGFPNLEWDIFRELAPRFLDGGEFAPTRSTSSQCQCQCQCQCQYQYRCRKVWRVYPEFWVERVWMRGVCLWLVG
ncbi:hypothetical protein CC80DRAFT_490655, partial [Byssothecium circinans]